MSKLLVSVVTFALSFLLALPISEIVIASKYASDADSLCNGDALVSPIAWLYVSGFTAIVELAALVLFGILFLYTKSDEFGLFAIATLVLFSLFSVAWTIIGGVVLWRDNISCGPQPMHDMMWASVIIHIVVHAFGSSNAKTIANSK